jgi:hypothetical protein
MSTTTNDDTFATTGGHGSSGRGVQGGSGHTDVLPSTTVSTADTSVITDGRGSVRGHTFAHLLATSSSKTSANDFGAGSKGRGLVHTSTLVLPKLITTATTTASSTLIPSITTAADISTTTSIIGNTCEDRQPEVNGQDIIILSEQQELPQGLPACLSLKVYKL